MFYLLNFLRYMIIFLIWFSYAIQLVKIHLTRFLYQICLTDIFDQNNYLHFQNFTKYFT